MLEEIPAAQAGLDRRLRVDVAHDGDACVGPCVGDGRQVRVEEHVLLCAPMLGALRSRHRRQGEGCGSGGGDHEECGGIHCVDGGAGAGSHIAVPVDRSDRDGRGMAQEEGVLEASTARIVVDEQQDRHALTVDPSQASRLACMASEAWTKLRDEIVDKAVVRGKVILSSGREADYYVDLRRVTLDAVAAPLVGRVMRELVEEWEFEAVGGLTLGADPVATAMLHSAAADLQSLDAFVVRKSEKQHGLQRRIEGPDVAGRRVLAVEDTSTTGGSVLTAVEALEEAGATVVGVAVIVDRGAGPAIIDRGLPYKAAYSLADLGLE